MNTSKEKAVLEFARVVVLAVVSWLLTDGVIGTILAIFAIYPDPATNLVITALITSILKGIDKYLHDTSAPETGIFHKKGLTGF